MTSDSPLSNRNAQRDKEATVGPAKSAYQKVHDLVRQYRQDVYHHGKTFTSDGDLVSTVDSWVASASNREVADVLLTATSALSHLAKKNAGLPAHLADKEAARLDAR